MSKEFSSSHGVRRRGRSVNRAVDHVTLEVKRGESFGLVGESGSGKSTLARLALGLMAPTEGRVEFAGTDITGGRSPRMREIRQQLQAVFQDPHSSLDSRMTVAAAVEEPLAIHKVGTRAERTAAVEDVLDGVGLTRAFLGRRPHALSGGQCQRVAIARALVLKPEAIVLDEPVSALDVSVQAQILNLLSELQRTLALTYLFIAHDLAVTEYLCQRLAVLYRGQIVETGTRERVFHTPTHPYTITLLAAVPVPDPTRARPRLPLVAGNGAADDLNDGCPFRPRCSIGATREICGSVRPPLTPVATDHQVACHFASEGAELGARLIV